VEGLLPPVETILDERPKHAVLLVDAVEERANMMMLAESTPGKRRGMPRARHILTFTWRVQRRESHVLPGETALAPPGSI
jgi:hypothetical protein